jgi:nucleoside-diphosphate-sugar epimerase
VKILILGGTTFFGKEIAKVFHDAGHSVTLFTRGNRVPPDLPPCAHLRGDRTKADDLKRAAGFVWDLVIDNLAYRGEDMRLTCEAFREVPHYILTSTVSVYRYADPYQQPLREETVRFDRVPRDEDLSNIHWTYARGKWEAEKVLRASKLSWTIFRPTVVYGPHDPIERGWWYLARMTKGGPLLLPDGGAASFRLAYSKDVARAYLAAVEEPATRGKTYNLAQEEIITLKDFLLDSARALGVNVELVNIPRERLGEMAGPHGDLVNHVPNIEAARRDLGFSPTPWKEYSAQCARWFRDEWRGDESKLLEGRPKELALTAHWKALLAGL